MRAEGAEQKSFKELLDSAPVAARADTVRLLGALSCSHEPGKFVLTMACGRAVTLDVEAVKEHTVLGGAMGQQLVQVALDAARVPSDLAAPVPFVGAAGGFGEGFPLKAPIRDLTIAWLDPPRKSPVLDTHPGHFPNIKIPYWDHPKPLIEDQQYPGPVPVGDPWNVALRRIRDASASLIPPARHPRSRRLPSVDRSAPPERALRHFAQRFLPFAPSFLRLHVGESLLDHA